MLNFFIDLNPVFQSFVATLFTWGMTALGSALVFFFKDVKKNIMNSLLGFSGGVMIAASFWSLLNPAVDFANKFNLISWLIVSVGFLCGGLLIFIGDKLYSHFNNSNLNSSKRIFLLVSSITLHNIPEGLIIGVAFGSIISTGDLIQALTLALGIGLQNFPEGSAVSLPLKREGFSCEKAFIFGQLSGIVEPVFAVIGVLLVLKVQILLPFLLAFAAGAMIYVVISELIPESQTSSNKSFVSLITIIGFIIMMILDIALG